MNKIRGQIEDRKKFVKLSIDDPKAASLLLMEKAQMLSDSKELGGTVRILSSLFYLSEQTIYQDFAK